MTQHYSAYDERPSIPKFDGAKREVAGLGDYLTARPNGRVSRPEWDGDSTYEPAMMARPSYSPASTRF